MVRELHEQAMDMAHEAVAVRDFAQDVGKARGLFKQAFELEREAAFLVPEGERAEPTRSILFRSAASLALQANLHNEAFRLVGEGMSGHPPPHILHDLLQLIDEIKHSMPSIKQNGKNGTGRKSDKFFVQA